FTGADGAELLTRIVWVLPLVSLKVFFSVRLCGHHQSCLMSRKRPALASVVRMAACAAAFGSVMIWIGFVASPARVVPVFGAGPCVARVYSPAWRMTRSPTLSTFVAIAHCHEHGVASVQALLQDDPFVGLPESDAHAPVQPLSTHQSSRSLPTAGHA